MTDLLLIALLTTLAVATALFVAVALGRPDRPDRLLKSAFTALAIGVALLAVYLYLV